MFLARLIVITACGTLLATSIADAQQPSMEDTKVGAAIAMRVAGEPYEFTGQATCTHAPMASIYGTVAQMWSVQHSEGSRSLVLTLWRPTSGSTHMFSLSASTGGKSYSVTTSKGPQGGSIEGSGDVKLALAGTGGTFAIDATTASGSKIAGTLKCDAFEMAMAEGGA